MEQTTLIEGLLQLSYEELKDMKDRALREGIIVSSLNAYNVFLSHQASLKEKPMDFPKFTDIGIR